jgi:hypothetical protein
LVYVWRLRFYKADCLYQCYQGDSWGVHPPLKIGGVPALEIQIRKKTFDIVLPQSSTVLVLESRNNVVMFCLKIGFSKVDASSFSRLD